MATELVGIELKLRGEQEVYESLQGLDNLLRSLGGRKVVQIELGKAKQRLLELKGAIAETEDSMKRYGKKSAEYKKYQNMLKSLRSEYKDVTMAIDQMTMALKRQKSFGQMYKEMSTGIRHFAQNMQTLGNTLTKIGTPMRRLLSGTVFSAGFKLLNLMGEGFSRATSRADILSTYKPVFKAMGAGLDTATDAWQDQLQTAYDKVYDSVVGLPTGIDEIVNEWKLLTIATQDYDKAANLAIAANNAILASGADENAQTTSRRELRTLMTTGKLTERQWDSLRKGIPVAWNAIEQDLKTQGKIQGSLLEALKSGEVTAQQFGELLIDEGINGKTKEVVNEMLHTYNAATANITNAFSNMGKNILATLDDILMGATGKDTIDYLIGMKDVIGSFSEGVQQWMRDNQSSLIGLMDAVKNFDYRGFFDGVGRGLTDTLNLATKLLDAVGQRGGMEKLGYFLTIAAPLGRAITILGGALKGFSMPLALVLASMRRVGQAATSSEGIFGGVKMLLAGKGKSGADVAAEATQMASATGKASKFMGGLSKAFKGWSTIAGMVGGTALVGYGTFKAFKSMLKDLKEMTEIASEIDWDAGMKILGGMTAFFGAFSGLSALIGRMKGKLKILEGGAILGGLSLIFSGAFWADMKLIKGGFKSIKEATDYLVEAVDNLKGLNKIEGVPQIKKNVQQAVAVFNAISELLQIEKNNPITGEGTSGLKELDSKSAKTIKNVANAILDMKGAIVALNDINGMTLDTSNIGYVMQRLQDALAAVSTTLTDMPQMFKEGGMAVERASGLNQSLNSIKGAFDALVGEGGILKQIPRIVGEMDGLARTGDLTRLKGKMKDLGSVLTSVYESLTGIGAGDYFVTNIDNFRLGLKSLKFAVKHLQEISGMEVDSSMVGKIQNIITNIKAAFDQDKIAELSETINTFKQSIKDALDSFEEFNKEIEISPTVKLSSNFQSSVNTAAKKIRGADGQLQSAVNSLPSTLTKRITVKLIVNAVTQGIGTVRQAGIDAVNKTRSMLNESTGGRASRNGVLYRSGGGSIFRPRGTDKIPAMLTEGEYVQKKQAVDFFGLDFMRKVNNMDVRGAMNELLHRAGTSIGVGRQSILNHTVNNNQRITQNINTNNPNFAGARMGRFVGAL